MSSIQTLTVMLDQQYDSESIEPIRNAIMMVKGVDGVELGPSQGIERWSAANAFKHEIGMILMTIIGASYGGFRSEAEKACWETVQEAVRKLEES